MTDKMLDSITDGKQYEPTDRPEAYTVIRGMSVKDAGVFVADELHSQSPIDPELTYLELMIWIFNEAGGARGMSPFNDTGRKRLTDFLIAFESCLHKAGESDAALRAYEENQ